MAAYVISYDLSYADGKDYRDLFARLEKSGAVRATESSWFLATGWTAIQIGGWLKKLLHKKDVYSVNVLSVGYGFASNNLPPAAVRWMNKHLNLATTSVSP